MKVWEKGHCQTDRQKYIVGKRIVAKKATIIFDRASMVSFLKDYIRGSNLASNLATEIWATLLLAKRINDYIYEESIVEKHELLLFNRILFIIFRLNLMYIFLNEIMWNFYRTNIDSGTCWIKLCDRDIYYAWSIFPIYVCIYICLYTCIYMHIYTNIF